MLLRRSRGSIWPDLRPWSLMVVSVNGRRKLDLVLAHFP